MLNPSPPNVVSNLDQNARPPCICYCFFAQFFLLVSFISICENFEILLFLSPSTRVPWVPNLAFLLSSPWCLPSGTVTGVCASPAWLEAYQDPFLDRSSGCYVLYGSTHAWSPSVPSRNGTTPSLPHAWCSVRNRRTTCMTGETLGSETWKNRL